MSKQTMVPTQKVKIGGRTVTRRLQPPRDLVVGKVSLKTVTSRGKTYAQSWIHLPAQLTKHPKFPFINDEQVLIKIDAADNRLLISKLEEPPITAKEYVRMDGKHPVKKP
jgi:hypothetical protein